MIIYAPEGDTPVRYKIGDGTTPIGTLPFVATAGEPGANGIGIASITQTTTSTEDDGNNIVTVTLTNGDTSTFVVQNGSKGGKGDPGAAATVEIGSVATGAAGSSASVTNSGTAQAAKLNFTIPQGEKGDPGDDGIATVSTTGSGNVITALDYNETTKILTATKGLIDAKSLGLGTAMRYIGTSDISIEDGDVTNPITIDGETVTVKNGDVVTYGANGDIKKEFIWTGSKWEEFGNEGNYKIKQQSNHETATATQTIKSISQNENGNVTVETQDIAFPVTSVNGQTGTVTIDVPTALADLTADSTHRTVTDAEKTAWNAKSNFSGNYNDLTNKPTIPTIPPSLPADGGNADTVDGKHASDFATASEFTSHINNKSNPHEVTAADVGAVPFTRKVNGKELSDDIVLDDVAVSQFKEQFAIGDTADEISSVTEWTQATVPSGFNSRERGCCYGNGYYVVAGTSGQMVYSRDCVSWSLVTAFTSDVITGLAYGNGRFVAVDSAGKIFSAALPSETWSQVYTNSVIIESVRYLNNHFIAVGENGFFATSNDALNWTQQAVSTTNTFIDSAYGNGYYIAVGASGTIIRSINLIDWFDCSMSDFGDIRTAMFTGKGFVIGGQSGKIAYSADGATWSMATNNTTSSVNWIRAFAYAEKRIYAVMYVSTGAGEIWVSKDDGATWTVDKSVAGRLWCIVHGDGRFVTSGDNGAIYTLNLDINWTDEEPSEGASIWHRYITTLSNGDKVISESYKCANVVGNLNLILDAINGEVV